MITLNLNDPIMAARRKSEDALATELGWEKIGNFSWAYFSSGTKISLYSGTPPTKDFQRKYKFRAYEGPPGFARQAFYLEGF